MNLSDKDRKLLWGRSGSRCALCKNPLVAGATETDPASVVADEAHIVGGSPKGPRGQERYEGNLDSYDNAILLCKVDHKRVDDQVAEFSVDQLRRIKAEHERWVNDRLSTDTAAPSSDPVVVSPADLGPTELTVLRSGGEVWDLVADAQLFLMAGLPDDAPAELADLANAFLDEARDWGEISSTVSESLAGVHAAKRSLDGRLDELARAGLIVLGGRRRFTLSGGNRPPAQWWQAALSIAQAEVDDAVAADEWNYFALAGLGPMSWCGHSGANPPELVFRLALAVPSLISLSSSGPGLASTSREEDREDLILEVLEASSFTTFLNQQQPVWNWSGAAGWEVFGGTANPELTQLRFAPEWDHPMVRRPFAAYCSILTGWLGDNGMGKPGETGALVAFDLAISLLELDANRRPSQTAYRRTPPPAPAAFGVEELAALLRQLFSTAITADVVADRLLPGAHRDHGLVALWVATNGVELERVIDLRRFRRVAESVNISGRVNSTAWPLRPVEPPGASEDHFVADTIDRLLAESGYRGARTVVNDIRAGLPRGSSPSPT